MAAVLSADPSAIHTALAARLTGLASGGFAGPARLAAAARLGAMGLPGRRDEYWRYTDPADLVAGTAPEAAPTGDDAPLFDAAGGLRIVFTDGVFDAAASDDLAADGVMITRLAAAAGADLHWAQGLYGVLEQAGQTPVARPFAALNTAMAGDGLLIRVTGRVARPIHVIYRHEDAQSDVVLRHCLRLDPGAELTLIESGPLGARGNTVLEVDLAQGARFHHIRAQGRDRDRRAATHVFARVGAAASFKSFTFGAEGRLTRNEAVIDICGDGAVAHVAGVVMGDAAPSPVHHDDTVFITHGAVGCESRQVFKKVLRNGATGVFQGKILVRPGAQKTDGYQISQALLLDGDSQFLAKPELEIYADDVKCSHGSTTGAIDDTALFYLRSRGVDKDRATSLLVLSFLADALAEIEDADLAAEIVARLENWLGLAEA